MFVLSNPIAPHRFAPTLAGLLVSALALMTAAPSHAEIYLDVSFGFPTQDDPSTLFDDDAAGTDFDFDLETNTAVSAAIGIDGGFLRSELEITFRDIDGILLETDPPSIDAGSGSFENISLMTNVFVDVPLVAGFEAFVGGGVGVVAFDGDISGTGSLDLADFDDAGFGFAYQFKAGLAYKLTKNLQLTAGYRYWAANQINFDAFELDEFEVHSIDLGLRLSF